MYKGFNINITKEFFEDEYNKYHTIGEKLKINSETTAYDILNKYLMDDRLTFFGLTKCYFHVIITI